ncbi:MAG: WYL domain-containing protein [Ignavibacteria bacterium]|nr:WYL domain-containing protein [Ignavibacteria bacterium]
MDSSQLRRCMKIVRFLSTHKGSSSKDIHTEILADDEYRNVHIRQIQRDLIALEEEQLLISEQDGRDKFWSIRKEWKNILPETYSGHQLLGLYVLKSYLTQFKGTRIEKDIDELIKKIEGYASGDVYLLSMEHNVGQMNLARINDDILIGSVEAVRSANWVSVTYHNQTENTLKTYPVFPCRLFTYNAELYLISYNPKYKNYLALALRNIRVIDTPDCPPDNEEEKHHFDEAAFTRERFGVFADTPLKVRIQIDAEEAPFFTNRNWHPTQTFILADSGDSILEMNVPLSPELTTWILGWKHYIKVLEPRELVVDVLGYLERIRERYE